MFDDDHPEPSLLFSLWFVQRIVSSENDIINNYKHPLCVSLIYSNSLSSLPLLTLLFDTFTCLSCLASCYHLSLIMLNCARLTMTSHCPTNTLLLLLLPFVLESIIIDRQRNICKFLIICILLNRHSCIL